MTNAPEYSERELYEITQMARLKFLGEEVAKQAMTEDELIIATMACLKYIDLDIKIDKDGKFKIKGKEGLVSEEGFVLPLYDAVWSFHEGFAVVEQGGKEGHINTKGELLADKWYDEVWNFREGFAPVRQGGKEGFIDKEGNWYDEHPN
jgi:hypothetical protein